MSETLHTDVLVVGGGGCGLSASLMLSDLGVDHLLVERHPGTSIVPKAHILNPRTMEILGLHGLADEVYAAGAPAHANTTQRWYTSLGGDRPWHRRPVHVADAWGGGALRADYARWSAYPHGNTPQIVLEPLLRRRAEERAPDRVRFHHALTAVTQDADGVTATVRDRATGREYGVRCRYLVGADGGKTVGPAAGITLEGPEAFVETESVYFRADLSAHLDSDDAVIRFFNRPTLDGAPIRTGLVAAGPDRWDRTCPEWTMSITLRPGADHGAFDEARAVAGIRERLHLPELPIEVISHMRWRIESRLADRYRAGRVFVAGDAAHQHSPFGGLGLNTAIQDAANLTWKLAAVLSGQAGEALLDSYEAERRPVGRANVDFATVAFFNTLAATSGFGLLPGAAPEHNQGVLEAVFADTPAGAHRRARLREYFDTMRMEGQAADIELGFAYDGPAVVPDGSPAPDRDPTGRRYAPTARPGHRLPHAEVDGVPAGTHGLLRPGEFLLLTDDPAGWAAAAGDLAGGVPLRVVAVTGDAWVQVRGHADGGAVLVRPDGHVGARFPGPVADPRAAVEAALATILARPDAGRQRCGRRLPSRPAGTAAPDRRPGPADRVIGSGPSGSGH